MKIALVVLAFDSRETIRRHLKLLEQQTRLPDKVILVNSGPNPFDWVRTDFPSLDFDIIDVGDIGVGGGFNQGMKKVFQDGYDYIVLADDDAYPDDKELMHHLFKNAAKGLLAVGGFYRDGRPVLFANHYFMIKRDVLSSTGFYFDPFFFYFEDEDLFFRISRMADAYYDPQIVVDHHGFTVHLNSARLYYFFRSGLAYLAIRKSLLAFVLFFFKSFFHSLFCLFFHGDFCCLSSLLTAFSHFLQCRMGKFEIRNPKNLGQEAEIQGNISDKVVLVHPGSVPSLPPAFSGAAVIKDEIPFLFTPNVLISIKALREIFTFMLTCAKKDIVVAGQFHVAYPPYSLLSDKVYLYDASRQKSYLFYRNNALLGVALGLIAPSLCFLLLPALVFSYFLKRGRYLSLYNSTLAEHLTFCNSHSDHQKA